MWLLIDGNNWFAQCEFASAGMGRNNFFKRLDTLIAQVEHSRAVVCWDMGRSWRCELCPSYKSHREAKPAAYGGQLEATRNATAETPGVDSIAVDGYEADDLIATFTAIAHAEGERVAIFSADKDLHQLIVDGSVSQVTQVKRLTMIKLHFETMNADRLFKTYGVKPWQWVDYRVVTGDASDGITGCPDVGEKSASKVLGKYGSLDDFFANPWEAPLDSRKRTMLMNFREEVPIKRRLLTLVDSVPVPAKFFAGAVS